VAHALCMLVNLKSDPGSHWISALGAPEFIRSEKCLTMVEIKPGFNGL
jgi:hypothetical protein